MQDNYVRLCPHDHVLGSYSVDTSCFVYVAVSQSVWQRRDRMEPTGELSFCLYNVCLFFLSEKCQRCAKSWCRWSVQGRIHQIEYAMEAVKQGSATVGLKSKTQAVLVALKVRWLLIFFLIDYYYYFVCCVCVLSWHELASYLWLSLQSKPVAWLQSIQEAIACVCVSCVESSVRTGGPPEEDSPCRQPHRHIHRWSHCWRQAVMVGRRFV